MAIAQQQWFSGWQGWVIAGISAIVLGLNSPVRAEHEIQNIIDSIEPYAAKEALSGKVTIVGSGSLASLADMWSREIKVFHKDAVLEATGGGSEQGLEHLLTKPGDVAAVTRPLELEDIEKLKKGGLKDPVAIIIGLDALAVFVHPKNPLQQITPVQFKQIYCEIEKGTVAATWGKVGVADGFEEKSISVYDRGASSGTQVFIERYLLQGSKIRKDSKNKESNIEIVNAVASDEGGIAIAPFYLRSDKVKILPVLIGDQLVSADESTILRGQYPLLRPLCLVFDRGGKPEDVARIKAMMHYVLSREGQLDAVKAGYFPLNIDQIRQQQDVLGVEMVR